MAGLRSGTWSVVFTDLVGSTEQRSVLGDSAADALLREHDRIVRRAADSHAGTYVVGTGDGAMLAFAGAADAVHAAVAIQRAVENHNRSQADPVGLRIGISLGDLAAEDENLHGIAANEAARVCALADAGEILVSDVVRVVAGTRLRHQLMEHGVHELKGLPAPTRVWRVLWERDGDEPGIPLPIRLEQLLTSTSNSTFGFCGRVDELAQLQNTLKHAAADGRLRMVLVAGEAGVGKTSLVARAAAQARDADASVLLGECVEGGSAPYQVWIGALAHVLRHVDTRAFAGLCGAHAGALRRLLPAHGDRLPTGELVESDADSERHLMMDAVVAMLEAASELTPLLLVLDDLHWIDAASVALLQHVVRASAVLRIVIVGTYRSSEVSQAHVLSGFLADLHREPGMSSIELAGLIESEVVELMEAAAARRLDDTGLALAHALCRDTGGNPFFVVEVLRHLGESGAIVHDDAGRWSVTAALDEIDLPASVRAVVGQRVARLGEDAVRMLSAAAVIGQDFDVDILGAVTDTGTDHVLDVIDATELAALVVETPDRAGAYRFAHALVQQTLYQQTSAARRRHTHLRVAEALSDLARSTSAGPAGAPGSLNARLAVHYELAGHPIDAIAAYRRAAVDALSVFALDESVRSLRRALDLTEELPPGPARDELELGVGIELGVPLVARDGYGSAASEVGYKRAFELSNQLGRPVDAPVLRGLGLAALMGCRFDDSSRFAVALLDQGAGDPVATTEGHYLLGVSAFWLGDLELADEQLSAAIATYRADLAHEHISRYAQDPKAISLVRLALTSLWLGEPDRAAALADDALNFADALGHPTSSGYVLAYAALTAAEAGDLARLERLIDAGDTLWTDQRLPMFANTGRSLRGWLDALAGRGVGALEAAVDCWRDERQSLLLVHSLALLARFYCRERDVEAGRAATREALDRIEVVNQRYLEPELLRIDGELLALDGDNVNAVATLERALETARARRARWLELRAACSLARLAPGPAAFAQLGAALDAIGGGRECADVQEAQSLLTRHR